MGINQANKILNCPLALSRVSLSQLCLKSSMLGNYQFTVCFDFNIILFSGVDKTVASSTLQPQLASSYVAEKAFKKCTKLIQILQHFLSIKNIFFFIDGKRPTAKDISHQQRALVTLPFDRSLASRLLKGMLDAESKNDDRIVVNQLPYGEAEHECFRSRLPDQPTIIISSDTDVYHIAYDYKKKCSIDDIFMLPMSELSKSYSSWNLRLIDLHLLAQRVKIPSTVFRVMLFLSGSDFSTPVFTITMQQALLDAFSDKKIYKNCKIIQDLEVLNNCVSSQDTIDATLVEKIIFNLLLILFDYKTTHNGSFAWPNCREAIVIPTASKRFLNSMLDSKDLVNYTNTIVWCVKYSYCGSTDLKVYFDDSIVKSKIQPFLYFFRLLVKYGIPKLTNFVLLNIISKKLMRQGKRKESLSNLMNKIATFTKSPKYCQDL